MNLKIPFIQDLSDYFVVRTKTITRIAMADIMENEMLFKWCKKIIDNQSIIYNLKGFGYFESEFSHGYIMASRRFNKMAIEVIQFQFDLRKINTNNNKRLSLLMDLYETVK